jgi:Transposase DDE domain
MKVTDEHVHDSKALPELVNNIVRSDNVTTIGKLFADGAYDNNDIFRYLSDNGILPCIKARKNARVRWKKGTSLETCQLYLRKKICKSGRIA